MERIRLGGHTSPKMILDSKCVVVNKMSPPSTSSSTTLSDNVVNDGRHQIIRPTPRRAIDILPNDNLRFVQASFIFAKERHFCFERLNPFCFTRIKYHLNG